MNYGELIDKNYNPKKEFVYNSFIKYYNNPLFTKIKDVDNMSMYVCKIKCLLSTTYRYLILFVYINENNIGSTEKLEYLEWESFQTRTLLQNYNIDNKKPIYEHNYMSRNMKELNKKIKLNNRNDKYNEYECEELSIIITLLHNEKQGKFEYANTGTIINCLETYNTIITYK
jgi:hypothetical protein